MKPRLATLSLIVLTAVVWRVIPHPWNFAPITAMALFAGAHFSSRRTAFILPIAAMAVSDLALGWHSTLPFVYLSFILTVAIGTLLRGTKKRGTILAASIGSSVMFFVLTNAGHWAVTPDYAKSFAGFMACFSAAVPFFRNTLLGDLVFTGAFFGGFALLERRFPALRDPLLTAPLRPLPH